MRSYPESTRSFICTFSQYIVIFLSILHYVYTLFTKRDFTKENYELLLQMVVLHNKTQW